MKGNKSKKVVAIILILLLIILVICGIMIIRKVSVFNSLISASGVTAEKTNYKMQKTVSKQEVEAWVMGEKYYQKTENEFQDGTIGTDIRYNVGEGDFHAMAMGDSKVVFKQDDPALKPNLYLFSDQVDTSKVFSESLKTKIKSVENEGKECYEMTLENGTTLFVEKETGLIIKFVENETTTTITYEFDIVTDRDIQEPDLTGYTEV